MPRATRTTRTTIILGLLPQVFAWARQAHPTQPLTSGVWHGDWSTLAAMTPVARVQIEQSDIISFHNYGWPEDFEAHVKMLQQFHRPLICTEYMARNIGSTFDAILPLARQYRVGAINWGLVAGKSQTWIPWDSWQHPYVKEQPMLWQHDIFHPDGTPYRPARNRNHPQPHQRQIASPYFPMQKVEKIRFSTSSAVVCPVSESSAHSPR